MNGGAAAFSTLMPEAEFTVIIIRSLAVFSNPMVALSIIVQTSNPL
jgi:hypothetical protein